MSAETVVSTGADQAYWDGLAEGRVLMQRCAACGVWHWPAVWRCAECGGWDQAWVEIEPTGEIFTWTRTWHPFPGTEALGSPFVSLVVGLPGAGGRRLTGLLEGDADGVAIGARVRGRVAETAIMGRVIPALRWRLEQGGGA